MQALTAEGLYITEVLLHAGSGRSNSVRAKLIIMYQDALALSATPRPACDQAALHIPRAHGCELASGQIQVLSRTVQLLLPGSV